MSGELQSIPARHGTATFVPKGHTIRIINTYGRQVVDTWIFALPNPPEREEVEEEEEVAKYGEDAVKEAEEEEVKKVEGDGDEGNGKPEEVAEKVPGEDGERTEAEGEEKKGDTEKAEGKDEEKADESKPETSKKSAWSSYIPSIRSRGKAPAQASEAKPKRTGETRTWASYFPSGKGFSSYLPTAKSSLSAFAASHQRDPTKSYAEQLYDFSKTPVGAATLSAATGSNISSSLYAAYAAYAKLPHPGSSADTPPMEYFSAPHTRAATAHVSPRQGDTLLSNLRTPLATIVEDTTAVGGPRGRGHDTLTPACDAGFYRALGVARPEEHGSCAENLVLALRELNTKAGLKGRRAIGADVSVNIAPTPMHLFMNARVVMGGKEGGDDEGEEVRIEEPLGPKRSHVKFRAERDVVFVMSACPNEKGVMNGGKCMAANFVVEEEEGEEGERKRSGQAKASQPKHGRKDSAAPEEADPSKDGQNAERRKPRKLERRSVTS